MFACMECARCDINQQLRRSESVYTQSKRAATRNSRQFFFADSHDACTNMVDPRIFGSRKMGDMFMSSIVYLVCWVQVENGSSVYHRVVSLWSILGFWTFVLEGYGALASQEHPVCRGLESNRKDQPLGPFPAKYVCHHHAEDNVICSNSETGVKATTATSVLPGMGSEVAEGVSINSRGHISVVGAVCMCFTIDVH